MTTKKAKQNAKPNTPINARSERAICKLPSDGGERGRFWWSLSTDTMHICEQQVGESPTQSFTMTRSAFEAMLRWYMTGSTRF
jgi:hypothetical protein